MYDPSLTLWHALSLSLFAHRCTVGKKDLDLNVDVLLIYIDFAKIHSNRQYSTCLWFTLYKQSITCTCH
jgi:hypothetical protein